MFCVKCGTGTPDDSQFCRKCGHPLGVTSATAAPPAAPIPPAKPKSRWSLGVFLVLLALILWWVVASHSPGARQLQQIARPQHTDLLNNPALSINPTGYSYFKLDVPPGASGIHLQGNFTASGGSGNDIDAYVLSEADFVNWQNRHVATTYYNSGKVTVGDINVNLPAAGTYYLVFDNRFSLLSQKSVRVNATLTYYP